MSCDFPACECMCHPDNCVFLEKNRRKGKIMNDQMVQEPVVDAPVAAPAQAPVVEVKVDAQGNPIENKEVQTQ